MSEMICQQCNGPLPEGSSPWRKFCPGCYMKRRRQRDKERWAERKAMEKVKAEQKKPVQSIAEVARAAQAHGMSYGQYVAVVMR